MSTASLPGSAARQLRPYETALLLLAVQAMSLAFSVWSLNRCSSISFLSANGALLAGVLLLRGGAAALFLTLGFAADLATRHFLPGAEVGAIDFALMDIAEVLLARILVRRWCGTRTDLLRPRPLAAFVVLVAIPVSALRALLFAAFMPETGASLTTGVLTIGLAEGLGLVLTTPALLQFARPYTTRHLPRRSVGEVAGLMGLAVAVTLVVFLQKQAPIPLSVTLPLLLIAFRLRPAWTSIAAILVLSVADIATLKGAGPIALVMPPADTNAGDIAGTYSVQSAFEIFAVAAVAAVLPVSALVAEWYRIEWLLLLRNRMTGAALEQARGAERTIREAALVDEETKLPNRAGLEHALIALQRRHRDATIFVAVAEIERYASIRAAIGSRECARIIEMAAGRLAGLMPQAIVARPGASALGFAFQATGHEAALDRLTSVQEAFNSSFVLDGHNIDIRLAIGLTSDGEPMALVHHAQIAADHALSSGEPVVLFDPGLERQAAGGLALLSDLHAGLENGAVWLSLQPKLNLRTKQIDGAECLVRWNHPRLGSISPTRFITLAEKTGYIDELTFWILREAVRIQRRLDEAGIDLRLSVNLSARSLGQRDLARRLSTIVLEQGGEPRRIMLELTETAVMASAVNTTECLGALKAVGFSLSIDDFGTGQSSLAYLRHLPADEIKLDRAFLVDVVADTKSATLVAALVHLVHELGLKVVAEGVEDEVTLSLLSLMGCDEAQGYYIAQPMQPEMLIDEFGRKALRHAV